MTEPELPAAPDLEAMRAALERARAHLSPEDHAHLTHAVELELKHLFNRIGREGWGWGINLAAGAATADELGWRTQRLSVKLPYTLSLRDGDAMLHVNVGLQKQRDERRGWVASAALEHHVGARTKLFIELGREDRSTLLHGGVRHWLKRDKFAIDFSVQQVRNVESKERGVVIGLGWYDL